MSYIAIIDYGLGNTQSICNALDALESKYLLTRDRDEILNSSGLILPGVGAYSEGMRLLKKYNLDDIIKEYTVQGKPLLGICLGMQLLLQESEEFGHTQGLGLIKGKVIRFPLTSSISLKLPHIGWSPIKHSLTEKGTSLLSGINNLEDMYFVHSYITILDNPTEVLCTTEYAGLEFCSILKKENIFASQFHPEKSATPGLQILKNFNYICKDYSND